MGCTHLYNAAHFCMCCGRPAYRFTSDNIYHPDICDGCFEALAPKLEDVYKRFSSGDYPKFWSRLFFGVIEKLAWRRYKSERSCRRLEEVIDAKRKACLKEVS